MTAILNSIHKSPAFPLAPNNTSVAKATRNNIPTTNCAAISTSGLSSSDTANTEPVSPHCASLPAVSSPGIQQSSAIENASIVQLAPHAVTAIKCMSYWMIHPH